jgi:hypothetical protein
MGTPGSEDRIRNAITEAAEKLTRQSGPAAGRDTPAPGDLYVFDVGDVGLEWLVVRSHPDDPRLLLLAPADDFPLAGTPDLAIPPEVVGRPLTVRCGETDWFPAGLCTPRLRAGAVPENALGLVRHRLADIARGRSSEPADPSVDFDPEYEDWVGEVARARVSLLARAGAVQSDAGDVIPLMSFARTPPAQFASVPEFSLAAESGGTWFAELGSALASSDDVKYHEVSDVPGGRLFLAADSLGVLGIWEGTRELVPRLTGTNPSGIETTATWEAGPEGRLHRTAAPFPWVDGLVALVIGTDPPRKMVVQL